MRLEQVVIRNFRCLEDVDLGLDDVTVLIGPNGAGKSTVLRALEWFFSGGDLDPRDVYCGLDDRDVSVGVTFRGLTEEDETALGRFAVDGSATFTREWSASGGRHVFGLYLAHPLFAPLRGLAPTPLKEAYNELRTTRPDMELPSVASGIAAHRALDAWEEAHTEQLKPIQTPAETLFDVVKTSNLAGRFEFLLVPASSNAPEQLKDVRGSLLDTLVSRLHIDEGALTAEVADLQAATQSTLEDVLNQAHTESLQTLASRLSERLAVLVAEGTVRLEAKPPEVKIQARPTIDVAVGDGSFQTDIPRQGHGFQRALMLVALQELAVTSAEGKGPPELFLAIEEPELYQHPGQARHLASVLAELGESEGARTQVAFATHSPFFVDPQSFERLRRFRRYLKNGEPQVDIKAATVESVGEALADVFPPDQIRQRVGLSLRTALAEGVFASGVLLVEGPSDVAVLRGFAEQLKLPLDRIGMALVAASGKNDLPIALAILQELDVPTFTIFDGDRGIASRKPDKEAEEVEAEPKRWNRKLLSMLGEKEDEWPSTTVASNYAVFEDRMEEYLEEALPGFRGRAGGLVENGKGKPEAYFEAALGAEEVPPLVLEALAYAAALSGASWPPT